MSNQEEGKILSHHHQQNSYQDDQQDQYAPPPPPPSFVPQYGTFEGIPQPAPPPGARDGHFPHHHQQPQQQNYYAHAYQTVPGYVVAEGTPIREGRLPCCGIGFGWLLFIIGFFMVGFPWYAGAIILMCSRNLDRREKPGYVACTIGAVLAIVASIFGVSKIHD